jgi:superfamily II DNA or RNA helicase
MAVEKALHLSYTDNERVTVAERLIAEIRDDPARLWVASGYFAPSVWAAIGEALAEIEAFRLLLGRSVELAWADRAQEEARIAELVRTAIREETEPPHLARRADAENVASLVEFLERHRQLGEPVVKLWEDESFLHAKAYILAGSVGIGSANFTGNGLTRNRELVGWRQDRREVSEVADWFKAYWDDERSTDYTDELIALLRSTPLVSEDYTPYDLLIRVLASRYGIERPASLEQASFTLHWFQEDAVFRLVRLLNGRARGALLADAVGLGKTYMALGVIHHYLYTEAERRGRGKPVLIVAPKSLEEMWRRELDGKGLSWACEFLTTQSLRSDFDVRPYQGADLVVIDEAHRLRGAGVWFRKMIDLVTGGDHATDRRVLLLTATPVNTGMEDLVNLLRVLTKNNRAAWVPEIADFERYLKRVERDGIDPFPILDRSIVRRSRSDILEAQEQAKAAGLTVERLALPDRRLAHVDHDYGGDDNLFDVFGHALRNLVLAPYDLERFRLDEPEIVTPLTLLDAEGTEVDGEADAPAFRPGSLAALCAVGLLVRFQSSLEAITRSLRRLDAVQRRFAEALALDPPRLLDLQGDPRVKRLLLQDATEGDRDEQEEPDDETSVERDWERVLAEMDALADSDLYHLDRVRAAIESDRAVIAELLAALPDESEDGKIAALIEALERPRSTGKAGSPGLEGRTVLLFSQFRDTARYLHRRLTEAGFAAALVEGSVAAQARTEITAWFDPARRDAHEIQARSTGNESPTNLVSTDVLAEGHNLQLADTVVNFDLHFNPQMAVQRAGRIDRIGSPHTTILLVSFLPPEALDRHIGLLARLDERFRRIHGLGLGDEQVTPLAADRQAQTLEQIRRLYADDASVLDEVERTWSFGSTDYMRQPLEAFLADAGVERVKQIPIGVSSVKRLPPKWTRGPGAFIALAGPPGRAGQHDVRETYWRFYPRLDDGSWGDAVVDEVEIFRAVACRRGEPRRELSWLSPGPTVIDWDLLRRAATELADQLTLERSTAEVAAGASERSRKLRTELRAGLDGLEIESADDLLERLTQVRVEDFDGRSGWRHFDDLRRQLRKASTLGERRELGEQLVESGIDLFGAPVVAEDSVTKVEVEPDDLQLVAYEALVDTKQPQDPESTATVATDRLFEQEGDQLPLS